MNKILIALFLSVVSTSYAATSANTNAERPTESKSENPQVQKHQKRIDNNNQKTISEIARKTTSKDKRMHIKDELTDINENEPADAVEKKSTSPIK